VEKEAMLIDSTIYDIFGVQLMVYRLIKFKLIKNSEELSRNYQELKIW
jgi:hypothetical protein